MSEGDKWPKSLWDWLEWLNALQNELWLSEVAAIRARRLGWRTNFVSDPPTIEDFIRSHSLRFEVPSDNDADDFYEEATRSPLSFVISGDWDVEVCTTTMTQDDSRFQWISHG